MDVHLFSEIAVNRFNNHLEKNVYQFIADNRALTDLYQQTTARYGRRVVNNIIHDFLVEGLRKHIPIFFSDDSEYEMAELFLEKLANAFIGSLPDLVFISIEEDEELMRELFHLKAAMPQVQANIREILMERYFVLPTGDLVEKPRSNLLNSYRRMMLKAEEEI